LSRYSGPRVRVLRALGADLPGLTRKTSEKRPYRPGQHGQARRKVSDYGLRLAEKQKVRMNWGVTEVQLRNLMSEAMSAPGATGDVLVQLLERRLDNIVFRAGFARTIPAARQLVTHGHVLVDGKRVDIASFRVKRGHVVTLKTAAFENAHVKAALADKTLEAPAWLERSETPPQVTVKDFPDASQAPFPLQTQLVVEFYSLRL
jgi:small subunit ribosomal protein S4